MTTVLRHRTNLIIRLIVVAMQVAACSRIPVDSDTPTDLLLITIDTARADRFSYAGPSPVDTPATDSLAREGAAFLCAVAPSPITLPSHTSLFTGQDPFVHGVRNNGEFALAPQAVTLAEVLAGKGWTTAAFIGAAVLDSRYGLDQGFTTYDDEIAGAESSDVLAYARRPGDRVVAAALRWLETHDNGRTFVWVHLFDAHAPYQPPEPEMSQYPNRPYDGAIAFADRVVGDLLAGYRRLGRYDQSLTVLTADHGESLGEHGENTHGIFVYDATIRIPLVIRGPGIAPGTRIALPVRLIDVMPTVLGLLGTEVPETVNGRDLGGLLRGIRGDETSPAIYVESLLPKLSLGWSPLRGLRTPRWKFIRGAAVELYDLEEDPSEQTNVAEQHADVVDELATELAAKLKEPNAATSEHLEIDRATRNRLAALGYVSRDGGIEAGGDETGLPDPRDQIKTMQRTDLALTRFARGDHQGAIRTLKGIVADEPQNLGAAFNLGRLQFESGDYYGSARSYGHAAELAVDDPKYSEYECLALERLGRFEEALWACDRALTIEPSRSSTLGLRWRLLAKLGRTDELITDLKRALAENPNNGVARVFLIRTVHQNAPPEATVSALEDALRDFPGNPALSEALAHALFAAGEKARAESLYRQVLQKIPGDYESSLIVGRIMLSRGETLAAREILETGVNKHPDRPEMQVAVARARMLTGDFAGARQALVASYSLDGKFWPAWTAAGELHLLEGHPEQAAGYLERAVSLGADEPTLWRMLAEAYSRLGRTSEAEAAAAKAARTPIASD